MANFYPPGYKNDKIVVAVDFDGVLHNADQGWGDGTCYGNPIPGSIDAIKKLSETYDIIIFTAKAKPDRPLVDGKTGTMLVTEWFQKYGIINCIKGITS